MVPGEEAAMRATPVLAVVPGEAMAARAIPCTKTLTATCNAVALRASEAAVFFLQETCESKSKRGQISPCHSHLSLGSLSLSAERALITCKVVKVTE